MNRPTLFWSPWSIAGWAGAFLLLASALWLPLLDLYEGFTLLVVTLSAGMALAFYTDRRSHDRLVGAWTAVGLERTRPPGDVGRSLVPFVGTVAGRRVVAHRRLDRFGRHRSAGPPVIGLLDRRLPLNLAFELNWVRVIDDPNLADHECLVPAGDGSGWGLLVESRQLDQAVAALDVRTRLVLARAAPFGTVEARRGYLRLVWEELALTPDQIEWGVRALDRLAARFGAEEADPQRVPADLHRLVEGPGASRPGAGPAGHPLL